MGILARYALSISAGVVLLVGCALRPAQDDAQPPAGAQYTMPHGALYPPYRVARPLLYVVNYPAYYPAGNVVVYRATAKDPAPLAEISDGISEPGGDCIDSSGTLYVTNQPPDKAGWVSEYALGHVHPSKTITRGIETPAFCAIDGQGDLWVTNHGQVNVTEYKKGSTKPYRVITKGLIYPQGIAFDHAGNLYVSNEIAYSSGSILVYALGSTSPSRTITQGVESPEGIALDTVGTLYVTNIHQNNVEEYKAGESVPYRTLDTGALNEPMAVTVNAKGWLYVTNVASSAIVEYAPGAWKPSDRKITNGLDGPDGAAYFPPVLP
jgi:hypothetical protein